MASKENSAANKEKAKTHQTTSVRGSVKDRLGSRVQGNRVEPAGSIRRKLFHDSHHTPNQASQADENHSRALEVREKIRGEDSRDQKEFILQKKMQQNKDAMMALRLQQEELEQQMAKAAGEQEATSKRRGHWSRSRSPRRGEVGRERSRHRSRSRDGRSRRTSRSVERAPAHQGRSGQRRRDASSEYRRDRHISSPRKEEIDPLARRIAELEKLLSAKNSMETYSAASGSPFSSEINQETVDPKKKMPPMETYDGMGDPYDHSDGYDRLMTYYGHSDAAK